MPVKKDDAHKALELLEDYCSRLTSPNDKQLRIAIEKIIYIFKSSLFQALLDIQEFYEAILLDESKDANSKALAVLRIADKWLEKAPLPNANEYRNGLVVQVGNNGANGGPSPINANFASKKSPSFHSNKSENMSVDGTGALNTSGAALPQDEGLLAKSYEDHWVYEQIVLERPPGVSLGFSIAGGADNPMYGNNTAIFITKLTSGGLAEQDGRLRPNDILFKVNDVSLAEAEHTDAVQALKEAGQVVYLVSQ